MQRGGAKLYVPGIVLFACGVLACLLVLSQYTVAPEPSPSVMSSLRREHLMPPVRARSPPRIQSVLRLAKFDCQNKAALLADRGGKAVVVEVGAFDGAETPLLASKSQRVYSFEATPSKEAQIRKNIGAYADRVTLHMAGVSDRAGTMPLLLPAGEHGAQQDAFGDQRFFMGKNVRTIDVPVVRLDDVVHEHVDVLFSDTQGHEWQVIRGAENLIRTHGIDILHLEFSPNLLKSSGGDPADFLRYLHDLGYVCFDCEAFGPPPADKFRTFDEFAANFGSFQYMQGDHGQWTDIMCFA